MQFFNYLWVLLLFPVLGFSQTHLVQNEGHFILEEGFLVLENSHFTNNAAFTSSDGQVKMTGDAENAKSSIGGTATTVFNDLTINKSANNVQLTQQIEVKGQLTLEGGLLDLGNFDLSLLESANPILGATANRYIKTSGSGQLKMDVGSTEKVFPIGNTAYNPVKLSNTGLKDLIGIRLEEEVLSELTQGTEIVDASVNRVWHLSEAVAGGSNLAINLQWNQTDELPNFDPNKATFAAFEMGKWVGKNTGVATGNNPFNFTGSNINQLGAFSIANAVCQMNGAATLGVLPPITGNNQLNLCGTSANLSVSNAESIAGNWTLSSDAPLGSANIINPTNVASALMGVFGGSYTLRWTVTEGACMGVFDEMNISFNPDEDLPGGLPDGVQDCMDICLGGNDLVNTDGFGAPDDCDCFPTEETNEFVEFNTPELLPFIEDVLELDLDTAKRTIDYELSSTASIEAKQTAIYPTVIFQAGNNIILEPGFHAKAGSDFLAIIESCRNPINGQINGITAPPETKAIQRNQLALPTSKVMSNMNLSIQPTIVNTTATTIIQLPTSQMISLYLFQQNGYRVQTLLNNIYREKGISEFTFDVQNLASGLYYLQLQSGTDLITKKLIVLK